MGHWVAEGYRQARGLLRRPGFAVLAVSTLALGIGATTTIITVVDSVMLRPLSYDDPEQIVAVGVTFPGREWREDVPGLQHLAGVSDPNFRDLRDRARSFDGLGGIQKMSALLPDQGRGPELVGMGAVTEDFFDILGVPLEMGRTFSPDEYATGARVLVLSYASWATRYGADPLILGRSLPEGSAQARVVVGVLSAEFEPPEALVGVAHGEGEVEMWVPLEVGHPRYVDRGARNLTLVGRLAAGTTIESARLEVEGIGRDLARDYPEGNVYPNGTDHFGYGVNSLHDETVGGAGRALTIFLGAAGLLLLVAALNAANLMLVRGLDRADELWVRRALGASRASLVRGVLTESVLLASLGGVLGSAVAYAGVKVFLWLGPTIPRMAEIAVDGRILAITAVVSIGAGVLAGLVPVFGQWCLGVKGGIRSASNRQGPAGARLRSSLVTVQLGMAVVLVVGASLLLRSFLRLTLTDPGFQPNGVASFVMPVKRPDGVPSSQSWDELMAQVGAIPGVTAVGVTSNLPFEDPNWAPAVRLPDDAPGERRTGVAGYVITPGYLETIGVDVVRGRGFVPSDGPNAQPVVMVNEAFLRAHFGEGDPLGAVLFLSMDEFAEPVRIVGVVADVVQARTEDGFRPAVYAPHTQREWPVAKVVVRSVTDPGILFGQLREAAARFASFLPVQRLGLLTNRIREVRTGPRFNALLLGTFAAIALLLATIGLYGSLAHSVGRRTRELGIRVAIGAHPGSIYGLVMKQGLGVAVAGLAIGLVGSVVLVRLLERYLFDVAPLDPVAFGAACVTLLAAAIGAVLIPARRAANVDVVECLKTE